MTQRQAIYVTDFAHKNPIPAACRTGNLIISSGIHGLDPATGTTAETLGEQCALMFHHVRAIVTAAGASTDDIVKITVWMENREWRDELNRHWLEMFPDPATRPARHTMRGNLDGNMKIQCDFTAVVSS